MVALALFFSTFCRPAFSSAVAAAGLVWCRPGSRGCYGHVSESLRTHAVL